MGVFKTLNPVLNADICHLKKSGLTATATTTFPDHSHGNDCFPTTKRDIQQQFQSTQSTCLATMCSSRPLLLPVSYMSCWLSHHHLCCSGGTFACLGNPGYIAIVALSSIDDVLYDESTAARGVGFYYCVAPARPLRGLAPTLPHSQSTSTSPL